MARKPAAYVFHSEELVEAVESLGIYEVISDRGVDGASDFCKENDPDGILVMSNTTITWHQFQAHAHGTRIIPNPAGRLFQEKGGDTEPDEQKAEHGVTLFDTPEDLIRLLVPPPTEEEVEAAIASIKAVGR